MDTNVGGHIYEKIDTRCYLQIGKTKKHIDNITGRTNRNGKPSQIPGDNKTGLTSSN
jgi:hypothetical protein